MLFKNTWYYHSVAKKSEKTEMCIPFLKCESKKKNAHITSKQLAMVLMMWLCAGKKSMSLVPHLARWSSCVVLDPQFPPRARCQHLAVVPALPLASAETSAPLPSVAALILSCSFRPNATLNFPEASNSSSSFIPCFLPVTLISSGSATRNVWDDFFAQRSRKKASVREICATAHGFIEGGRSSCGHRGWCPDSGGMSALSEFPTFRIRQSVQTSFLRFAFVSSHHSVISKMVGCQSITILSLYTKTKKNLTQGG